MLDLLYQKSRIILYPNFFLTMNQAIYYEPV